MSDLTALPPSAAAEKVPLRTSMRRLRRELADRDERSVRLWRHVASLSAVAGARRILVFSTIVGEPEVGPFLEWCHDRGIETAVPEDAVGAEWPDVVIVPGLAFTADGARLGQGGGWYDRFLADRDPNRCVTVGVCFAGQLVASLPTEPHDVKVDHVVTDAGVATGAVAT
jgi:5-formyltetrahydrofolate cyclo-ligase